MAPRANWKGFLKVGEVVCPVALYTAASTSDRIAFHTLNRKTGNRVRRQYVDAETGRPVEREDQVKGYETSAGEHVVLEPDEVAAAVPESDKTFEIDAFIPCDDVDDVYFDKPYYLAPADPTAHEAFALIREGMRKKKVAALARTVLFRRERMVLIRPHDVGLVGTTLNFDYEVRSSADAFSDLPKAKIQGEMLDLARHIIDTKRGAFDPSAFDDRYEAALAELVKAKIEGRKITPRKPKAPEKVTDLMEALRQSAGASGDASKKASSVPKRSGKAKKTAAASRGGGDTERRKAS
ncbi:Ku protein [Methylopila turkensis]|uniref:Non-homologous end joining protein Ku n=1 Tax=Methylopila turkensis TaxID=1437816 RepID=A0A9W6JMI3_9HYPH|nr:Ku protein [Methylopila turkensis]GLK78963.1 non-homologous end joining protein Ku [Methylopila turkensis]